MCISFEAGWLTAHPAGPATTRLHLDWSGGPGRSVGRAKVMTNSAFTSVQSTECF